MAELYIRHKILLMSFNDFLSTEILGVSIRLIASILVKGIIIYIFVRIATAITKYLFKKSQEKQGRIVIDNTKVGFLRQIVLVVIYIIGISAFLSTIPGMQRVSDSILASAGIVAMAVGLASQEALSNVVGGLFIIFCQPFKVGDFIQIEESIYGVVTEITLRHTVLRNLENRMIIIPNNKINSSTVINSSYGEKAICAFVEVSVAYTTNINKAIQIMRDEIMKNSRIIDHRTNEEKEKDVPQVMIRVINLGESSITLRAWAWAASSSDAYYMKFELLKAVKERFDHEGIEIPYPYFNQIVSKK